MIDDGILYPSLKGINLSRDEWAEMTNQRTEGAVDCFQQKKGLKELERLRFLYSGYSD